MCIRCISKFYHRLECDEVEGPSVKNKMAGRKSPGHQDPWRDVSEYSCHNGQ